MLVTFGARGDTADGVDLLLECHVRIRRHLEMARRLAAASGHAASEIGETAAQVRRYFSEALPLHILDEEVTVIELLAGRSLLVDAALARMSAEHQDHEPALERLVALCAGLQRAPDELARVAGELAPLVATLEVALGAHLDLEERMIFPALRTLPQADRDALGTAMRERRIAALELERG